MHVVICGGGAIGASTAYFLACRDVAVTLVERSGIACAASGKSGGFLARQWCDGTPVQELARRSFDLHAELADGSWADRYLFALAGPIYAGTNEIQRSVIAERLLGLPR